MQGGYKNKVWQHPHKEETRLLQCVHFSWEAGGVWGRGRYPRTKVFQNKDFVFSTDSSLDRAEVTWQT